MANRERLGILISGGGTTMQEIVKASQSGELPLDVAVVIASKPGIGGIDKALKLGVPVIVFDQNSFRGDDKKIDQYGFGQGILAALREHGTTMVSQNGWLPMTPNNVIEAYEGAITNQHPGLLPDFGGKGMYGRRVHAATIAFHRLTKGPMYTEATAQRVSKGQYDAGAVFANSKRVPILGGDDVDDLQQRVLPIEHRVQIEMLKDAVAGRLVEVHRESIVRSGQEVILAQVKKIAQVLYPHG